MRKPLTPIPFETADYWPKRKRGKVYSWLEAINAVEDGEIAVFDLTDVASEAVRSSFSRHVVGFPTETAREGGYLYVRRLR